MDRRTVFVGPQQWSTLQRLAKVRTVEEDKVVTASELARRGIAREIEAIRGTDSNSEYAIPEDA